MYWHAVRLLPPGGDLDPLTVWGTEVDEEGLTPQQRVQAGNADGSPYEPVPGEDYFVNEDLLRGPEAPEVGTAGSSSQQSRSCNGFGTSGR